MNSIHNVICSSGWWARRAREQLVPWGLEHAELGDRVLELGPGFGAITRLLAARLGGLTVVELDERYCRRLQAEHGDAVTVVQGDATELPLGDSSFSAVVCFTMLHHLASPGLQDRAFAEVARVLRPGGVFAGTDSIGSGLLFRSIHVGDTLTLIDPDGLPARLQAAELLEPRVERGGRSFRFRARRPPA